MASGNRPRSDPWPSETGRVPPHLDFRGCASGMDALGREAVTDRQGDHREYDAEGGRRPLGIFAQKSGDSGEPYDPRGDERQREEADAPRRNGGSDARDTEQEHPCDEQHDDHRQETEGW